MYFIFKIDVMKDFHNSKKEQQTYWFSISKMWHKIQFNIVNGSVDLKWKIIAKEVIKKTKRKETTLAQGHSPSVKCNRNSFWPSYLVTMSYLLQKTFTLQGFPICLLWAYISDSYSRKGSCALNFISMFLL